MRAHALVVFLAVGCASSNDDRGPSDSGLGTETSRVCVPGETRACVGPGACPGGQACFDNGEQWGPCDCGPPHDASADATLDIGDAGGDLDSAEIGEVSLDSGADAPILYDDHDIVYMSSWDIWSVHSDGTSARNLTSSAKNEANPSWSADHSRIAFLQDTGGSGFDLLVMNADGTGVARVTNTGSSGTKPAWTPSGRIVFHRQLVSGDDNIFIVNADGTGEAPLTTGSFHDLWPTVSPDEMYVVFSTDRDPAALGWSLFIMAIDGRDVHELITPGGALGSSWSPDGSRLVFTRTTPSGTQQLMLAASTGTGPVTELTSGTLQDFEPDWSPNGGWIVFGRESGVGGVPAVYTMKNDGTLIHAVTAEPAQDPDW